MRKTLDSLFLCLTSVGQSGDNDSAAPSGCDQEAGLNDGDDGQALGLRDHMSCNTHTKTKKQTMKAKGAAVTFELEIRL